MAQWLVTEMTNQGHAVALLSGELTVQQRISVLDRFREGKEKVLITTNVLSRGSTVHRQYYKYLCFLYLYFNYYFVVILGIDIEQVTIVINFDLPITVTREPDFDTYLHRIGRTGRFGKKGIAINLVNSENDIKILRQIEEHFCKPIECLNTDNADDMEKLGSTD